MNLKDLLVTQIIWSAKTFGHGRRSEGLCKHVESELEEIRAGRNARSHWINIAILALDAAWRDHFYPARELLNYKSPDFWLAGGLANDLQSAVDERLLENMFSRKWPETTDREPFPQDQMITHVLD